MKNSYFCYCIGLCFALLVTSCSHQVAYQVDYLPCQQVADGRWGFVSPDGIVAIAGQFDNEPSAVVDGMFTVQSGSCYQLYQIREGQLQMVADSLLSAGTPAYGLVPVCRESGKVEILNAQGETVFHLDEVDNQVVVGTDSEYKWGMLKVRTNNSLGQQHVALIGTDGNAVMAPRYTELEVISPDLFWVMIESSDMHMDDSVSHVRRTSYFINNEGNRLRNLPEGLATARRVGCHIVGIQDSTLLLYSLSGERCASFTPAHLDIVTTTDSLIVLRHDDSYYGVDMNGRTVTRAYSNIVAVEDGLVGSLPDHSGCDLLTVGGKVRSHVDGWYAIEQVEGFGYIASRGSETYVWDYAHMTPVGNSLYSIATLAGLRGQIQSTKFHSDRQANMIVSHLLQDAKQRGVIVGAKLPFVSMVMSMPIEYFSPTARTFDTLLVDNSECRIRMHLGFDTVIVRDKYIFERNQQMTAYGTMVERNKMKKDGIEFNPEARLTTMDLHVHVADTTDFVNVFAKVRKQLAQHYTDRDSCYVDGLSLVRLTPVEGGLVLHAEYNPQLDPEVLAADSVRAALANDSVSALLPDSMAAEAAEIKNE